MVLISIKKKKEKVNDMRRLFFKISLLVVAVVAFVGIGFAFNGFGLTTIAYAEEPEYTATGSCGTSANWYYYEETGTLSITGSGAINSYSDGNSPWSSYVSNIKKIIVADEITSIGRGAFQGCNKLQEISLPFVGASRTATGPSATFGYVFGYTTLNAYSSGTSEYKGIFNGDNTTCVGYVLKTGYNGSSGSGYSTSYGYQQYNSSGVTYSTIGFSSIQGYTTSSNTTFYDYRVGSNTNPAYSSPYYYTYAQPSGTTWQYSCNDYKYGSSNYYTLQSYYYYIPSTLTKVSITNASKVETAAFMNCSNITEINLNSEITSVGDYAFRNCSKLDVFDLPTSLTSLGKYVMRNCDALTDIEIPEGVSVINEFSFYDCDKLEEVKFNNNITNIKESSFEGCERLKDVDLPENLVTIGTNAFVGDTAFTKIVIPNKVTTVGKCSFKNCSNVMSITFGTSVKTITEYAFEGLSKIETINVPINVTSIGRGAFQGCNKLQEISLPFVGASRTATGPSATFGYVFGYTTLNAYSSGTSEYKGIFNGDNTTCVGYVLKTGYNGSSGSGYSTSYGYQQYNSSGVTYSTIGFSSIQGYTTSSNTTFYDYRVGSNTNPAYSSPYYYTYAQPSGTTWQYSCNDYKYGSSNYYTLQSYYYYIPSTLTKVSITNASKVETAAFMNCSNITEINLNSEITSVGDYAFRRLGLATTSTDDYVISGDVLILYKGNSKAVIVPDGIDIIAPRAFYANKQINTVNLPESVTFIGANAFYSCSNAVITVPKISGSLTVGSNAFSGAGQVVYLDKSSYTNGNDTFYFTINDENKAIIVACSTTSTNITLPTTLSGYEVTRVGYRGMANCTTLTSVTIPSNIIALDLYSFYGCNNITTVTIPATCTHVGDYAFMNCTNLHSVTIAEGVLYVGDSSFYGCTSLAEIVIPDSCTYLGKYAFYGCTSLETASIGILVPDVNEYTFYNCNSLASVVLGISVETIGDYAFYNNAITRVTTPTTLKSIGNYAYENCNDLTKVTLRNGFETIGDGAFKDSSSLNSINIVSSIKEIGSYAFYGCSSLTSTTIPTLVSEINDYTYAYCTSLTTVTVNGSIMRIGNKAFYRDALTSFDFGNVLQTIGYDAFAYNQMSSIVLPDSINYLGEQAFDKCNNLADISLPDDIAFVGVYAFPRNINAQTFTIRYNTGSISSYLLFNTDSCKIIISEGITDIGDYAFAFNERLSEIVFPSTLINVGNYAFYENRSYSQIVLPSNTKTLGDYAFARGYTLSLIKLPDSITSIGANCFYRDEDKEIHPDVTVQFYYNEGAICAELLKGQWMHRIIVDDKIYSIGNYAFANASNLISTSLPDSISSFGGNVFYGDGRITLTIRDYDGLIDNEVYKEKLLTQIDLIINNTDIGDGAFYGCTGLQTLVINDNSNIGDYAFYGCSGLQTATINDESNIGDYAFAQCIGLKQTSINDSSILGAYAFYNCNSMTTFTILGEVITIKEHCFDSCKSLKAMALPLTVNYIGGYAFYDCNSMSSINIPVGIEKILSHTFYGCSSLLAIVTPNTVDEIQDYAFYGCIAAQTISISSNCESIGDYTFYNCKSIEELLIPDSVIYIGEYAFRSCLKITELRFSDNVEEIGACAFYDCNLLEKIYLGKRIIELKDRLFYACVNLTDLYIYAPLSYVDELAFYGAEECVIHMGYDTYMISMFDELGMTYEIDDSIIYEYKVVFVDWDDSIISSLTYHSGDTVLVPANPTRAADNAYTYVFKSWDKDISVCGGNTTYKALYNSTYIDYTVVFKNYDGTVLSSTTYHYGDSVNVPANPTKPSDNTYTYAFKSWDKEVVNVAGDATYTATYNAMYIDYTVIFKNYDGTVLSTTTYHYSDVVNIPATPTKQADNTYSYIFKSWDKEVVNVAGDVTYTATYNATYIDYTVVFKNYDGTILSSGTYHYGDSVNTPANPTKQADNTYTYTFAGWDHAVTVCSGDTEYIAQYNPVYIEYTIVFKNYDDSVLNLTNYHYGDIVSAPETPSKPSDNTYYYTFNGWDNTVVACNGDATYIATYLSNYREYNVVFKNYDGTILSSANYHYNDTIVVPSDPTQEADLVGTFEFVGWDKDITKCYGDTIYTATYSIVYIDYTVVFKNYDGTVLSSTTYHYGDTVNAPTNPTKLADNTYTYAFKSWDKEVVNVAGDATYTATYDATYIDYTIVFKNYDGTVLSSTSYHYGDTVNAPTNPTKSADSTYSYAFKSWDKEVVNVAGDATYTATYDAAYIDYTVVFKNYDGTVLSSANYHYGDTVNVPANPTKPADNTYTYAFKSWNKQVVNVDGDATYTATYDATYIDYTIVFKNYDGTVLSSTTYHYGDTVNAPTNPTKLADNTYTYAFKSWDKEVVNVAGDATYTATYDATYIDYTVVFKNYDGTVLSSTTYHYGDMVSVPTSPTKPSDNTYSYVFNGWDKTVTLCIGNAEYTAVFNAGYIEYVVVFKNYDDSEICRNNYHYGDTVIEPDEPAKATDLIGSYQFAGWDKEVVVCTKNVTYKATFTTNYCEYKVEFRNYDGTVLHSDNYHYGDSVFVPQDPNRASDEQYDYSFAGWDKEIVACVGNTTYTATYSQSENASYKSTVLLNELSAIIEGITTVDLNTYDIIKDILDRSEALTSSDKVKLNEKLRPVLNEYKQLVQSINEEYSTAKEIEHNYFIVVLEMINYLTMLAYAALKGKRWFL